MLHPNHYELDVWKEAMRLGHDVYSATRHLPDEERFGLIAQMRRAAVSIPSNIAEGSARGSKPEFIRFLLISRGSSIELDTQIWLCKDLGFMKDLKSLRDQIDRLFAKLNAFITHKRKPIRKTRG